MWWSCQDPRGWVGILSTHYVNKALELKNHQELEVVFVSLVANERYRLFVFQKLEEEG